MLQNLRNKARNLARRSCDGFVTLRNMWALAFLTALAMVSGQAFAGGGGGSDPAGAITSELSGLADSVGSIIVLLAAALAIIILWGYVKKSR